MSNTTVVIGPASETLAKKIAQNIRADLIKTKVTVFPDGENKITIKDKPKQKVIIVQSTHPPVDTHFIQLFSMIYHLKKFSNELLVVVPYLGYSRQDKEFLPNEVITSKVISTLLEKLGVSQIVTVDIHSKLILKFYKNKMINVSATLELAKFCKKLKLKNPVVVAVDSFWEEDAKKFAKFLGLKSFSINKFRDRKTGKVKVLTTKIESVKNKDIILLDDMISSGSSMILAAKYLKKKGCTKIIAVCTHALLVNDARKKMRKAGISKIIATNTILQKESIVDVSKIIAKQVV